MAFIHVVIPVYNAERYLRETVDSVLSQPFQDIDIILVNDGSTDGSAAICDELSAREDCIRVIHQENAGVSAARNAGIESVLSTGVTDGYIAFLDSDDLWCPGVFTSGSVAKHQINDPDIISYSIYGCNSDAARFRILHQNQSETIEFPQKYQMKHLWAGGSFAALLYHVRLFRENPIRFVVGCRHNEDEIFAAKMMFCSRKIQFTDRFLYVYRKNRGSVTSTNKFHLGNATHIPDSWYAAADFTDDCLDIPDDKRASWKTFCINTSAIRCLELIRELSIAGYRYSVIQDCFAPQPYFPIIAKLQTEDLAQWQQDDLRQYNASPESFCRAMRCKGALRQPLQRLLLRLGILAILEPRHYPLTKEDILCRSEVHLPC